MKTLVLLFVVMAVSGGWAQDLSCAELEKMAESGVRKMFVAEEGAKIPTNEAEFDARCNDGKKLYKSLLEYKKCLKPFPKEVFSATSQSIGKLMKKNCGDAEGKKTALKLISCVGEKKIHEGRVCATGSLDAITKLSQSNEPRATLLPKICCLAHVSSQCAREKLGGVKCDDPTIDPAKHFEELLNTLSKDAMDIACADYKDIGTCNAKIPAEMVELKTIVMSGAPTVGQRSLIAPLLAIAEKVAN